MGREILVHVKDAGCSSVGNVFETELLESEGIKRYAWS